MKKLTFLLILPLLCGCAIKAPKLYKPVAPAVLADGYTVDQYTADKKAYETAVSAGNMDAAQVLRNKLVWNLTWTIDNAFQEYSQGIGALRATSGVASDLTQAGLSATSAITHTQRVKDVLSIALLGTSSLTSSVKARYFANVSPEILIGAMQQSRAPIADQIRKSMALSVKDYPFEQARADLGKLYYAGTLESALLYLAASANKQP